MTETTQTALAPQEQDGEGDTVFVLLSRVQAETLLKAALYVRGGVLIDTANPFPVVWDEFEQGISSLRNALKGA